MSDNYCTFALVIRLKQQSNTDTNGGQSDRKCAILHSHCKDTNFPLCTQTIYKKNALKGLFFDIYQHQKAFFFYFSLSNACFCIQKVSSFAISVTFAFQMRTTMRKSLASCYFPAIEKEHSEYFFPKTPIFLLFLFHIPIIYCIFAEDLQ